MAENCFMGQKKENSNQVLIQDFLEEVGRIYKSVRKILLTLIFQVNQITFPSDQSIKKPIWHKLSAAGMILKKKKQAKKRF